MKRVVQKVQLLKNLSKTIANGDQVVTTKNIVNALQNKTNQDIIYAEKHLIQMFKLVQAIQKQLKTQEKMFNFIKELEIEFHSQHSVIFNIGDIGRKMYFVLSGTLQTYAIDQRELNHHNFTKELTSGEHFGEISLQNRIPRQMTVICKTNSILISVNYETFTNYVQQAIEHIFTKQISFIQQVSLFRDWSNLMLSLILHHLKELIYLRGQYVYKEGQHDQNFYIIKKGEIIIEKNIIKNQKKQEYGLICISIGQCFGDFEFKQHKDWSTKDDNQYLILRQMNAKSTTETVLYSISINAYMKILKEYQQNKVQKFFMNQKSIIQLRLDQLQKSIIKKQKEEAEQSEKDMEISHLNPLNQEQNEIVLESPFKLKFTPSNPYQNLLNTIRSNSNSCHTSKQVSPTKSQHQTNCTTNLQPTLIKFDRHQKILLLKKLKEASLVASFKDNFLKQQSSVKSISNTKRQQQDQDSIILQSLFNSKIHTPNNKFLDQNNLRSQKAFSFKSNDLHDLKVQNQKNLFPRSQSQFFSKRNQNSKSTHFKFELQLQY